MQKNLSSAVAFGGKKGLQRIKNIESLFHGRKLRNLPTHKGADALFLAIFLRNQTNPLFLLEKTRKILSAFLKTYIRRAKHKIYYYVQAYCGNSRLRGVRRFVLPQSREKHTKRIGRRADMGDKRFARPVSFFLSFKTTD